METIQSILFIVQLIVAFLMIIMIILQNSDSDSLSGIGGNISMGKGISVKSSHVSPAVKITIFLIGIFMINGLALATISSRINNVSNNVIERSIEKDFSNGVQKSNEEKKVKPFVIPEAD